MDDPVPTAIILVGPGRAGRAFARSWTRAGGSVLLAARDVARARELAGELDRAQVVALDAGAPLAGEVLVLAVPDDAIADLASELAPRASCRFAFHLSGALPGAAIAPFGAGGARLGSLHPLRAFSGAPGEDWRDAFVAVEGEDGAAAVGLGIARAIGARPHRLESSEKPLYHAAATLAAGGTASVLSFAARIWREAGLDEETGRVALAELASTAVAAVADRPFDRALTGPVARRDTETVRLHARSLASRPDAARLYALLAAETLRRTPDRGREREIEAILAGLEGPPDLPPPETAKKPDDSRRKA